MGTLEKIDLSSAPGLGAEDFTGFPADECPEVLPDLKRHHSSLADVLKQDGNVYQRLRARKTSLGVGLARCIKVGMDNRGHAMVKTIGIVAGDEESYEVFRELFDPVIRRHLETGPRVNCDSHPTILSSLGVHLPPADALGRFVVSSQIRVYRSLRGFRFPPAMSLEERMQVERISVRALSDLGGSLRGEYFPLVGSQTHLPKVGGMRAEDEESLRSSSLLFETPDSTLRLCTGGGRHWPHARGVFVNGSQTFCAWVNEQEHLRLVSMQKGDALGKAFSDLVRAMDEIAASIRRDGEAQFGSQVFARSSRLGFLTSNPAVLGTTMHISVMVKLPCLASLETDGVSTPPWRAWCLQQRVQARRACADTGAPVPGLFEVSNCDRLGFSEVELVTLVNQVVNRIVQMELRLEAGKPYDDLLQSPVSPNCSDNATSSSSPAQCSLRGVLDKARVGLLCGLASGQLADAICTVGLQASSSGNRENAALIATSARITSVSPKTNISEKRDIEHACAEAVVNGIVDAVIMKDDKHDRGSNVILSTTPSPGEEDTLDDIRMKVQRVLLSACDSGALENAFKDTSSSSKGCEGEYDTASAIARARQKKQDRQRRRSQFSTEASRNSEQGAKEQYDTCSAISQARQRKHDKQQQRLQARSGEAPGALREKAFTSAPAHYMTKDAYDTTSAIARARERKADKQRRRSGIEPRGNQAGESPEVDEELQSLDDLKDKLHSRIANAFDTGRLEEVMASALTPSQPGCSEEDVEEVKMLDAPEELDDLRLKVHDRMTNALEEGTLDTIMAKSFKERGSKTERGSLMMDAPPAVLDVQRDSISRSEAEQSPRAAGGSHDGRRTHRGSLMMDPPDLLQGQPRPPSSPKPAPPKVEAAMLDVEQARQLQLDQDLYAKEEEMRLKARSILMKATFDDSLDRALALVEAENEAALLKGVDKDCIEATRLNIQDVLMRSQEDGSLQQALQQTEDEKLEGLRCNMSTLLRTACDNGELADALQTSKAESLEDIRANMSALLVNACDCGDLEKALQQFQDDKLEDIRANMSELLWSACEAGHLELALQSQMDSKLELEDIRENMSALLWSACESGQLENALQSTQDAKKLEDIRENMSALLWSACENGHLEEALQNTKASASTPKKPTYMGTPSPPVKSSGMKIDKPAVELAMEAMSQRDRRIGELLAMIGEAKQKIAEREESCQMVEEKLGAARVDLAHLELDVEWHRRALGDAKDRSTELEVGQRKLLSELDGHQQKLRHAKIEAEESCLMSARSELSTATGGATASSLGCFTPRNVMTTTVLDPLLLSTPLPNRW